MKNIECAKNNEIVKSRCDLLSKSKMKAKIHHHFKIIGIFFTTKLQQNEYRIAT